MSELELLKFKEYKKYLRLSMERELYTIPQAAFRLNVSRNEFKERYLEAGLIRLKVVGGRLLVPASEIKYCIDQMQNVVHKNSLRRVQ